MIAPNYVIMSFFFYLSVFLYLALQIVTILFPFFSFIFALAMDLTYTYTPGSFLAHVEEFIMAVILECKYSFNARYSSLHCI